MLSALVRKIIVSLFCSPSFPSLSFSLSLSLYLSIYLSYLSIYLSISLSHGSRHEQLLSILFFTINKKNAFLCNLGYRLLLYPTDAFSQPLWPKDCQGQIDGLYESLPSLYLYLYLSPFLYFLL